MVAKELKRLITEFVKAVIYNADLYEKHKAKDSSLSFIKDKDAFDTKGRPKVLEKFGYITKVTDSSGKEYKYRNLTIKYHLIGTGSTSIIGAGKSKNMPYFVLLKEGQSVSNGIYPLIYYNKKTEKLEILYDESHKYTPLNNWSLAPSVEKSPFSPNSKKYKTYDFKKIDYKQMLSDLDDIIDDYEIALGISRTKRADGTEGSGTGNILAVGEAGLDGEKKDGDPKKGGMDDKNPSHPLNLILYGPPGTGKTYNTLFKALAIIEGKTKEELEKERKDQDEKWEKDKTQKKGYELLKERYDKAVETGQIVFTAFHQSMSYEDFIEGIKPIPIEGDIKAIHENDPKSKKALFGDGTTTISNMSRMKYDVRDGIFKKIADSANKNRQESEDKGGKIISVQKLLNAFCDYAENKNEGTYLIKDGKKWHEIVPRRKDNEDRDVQSFVIKYGSGQHLTFSIINRDWESFKKREIKTANDIKPKSGSQPKHGNANYYFALYKALEEFEKNHNFTQQKSIERLNYVLIIDEINRGNVAQIFGELITLIESSKRLGNEEEMTATLPYSSTIDTDTEPFGVPNNLYIIGTMNTADRSVEALDTALRRRFSFEEMMPKPELLRDKELCGVKLSDLLTTINQRIVALKDREHQIGHSYFMGCPDDEAEAKIWLTNVFKDKIIPLLQEYFYGDYKKIYYVLGPGFVEPITDNKPEDIFPVKIDDDFDIDQNITRYEIKSFDEINIEEAVKDLISSTKEKAEKKKEKIEKEKMKEELRKEGYKVEDIIEIVDNGKDKSLFTPEP